MAVKLFEADAKKTGISSIVRVPDERMQKHENTADSQEGSPSLPLLAVGAIDGSVTVFTASLVGICTLKIAAVIREPWHRTVLEKHLAAGELHMWLEPFWSMVGGIVPQKAGPF